MWLGGGLGMLRVDFIESCVLDVYVAYSFMIFKYDLLNANDE
jgi:hypothetical protein